jgi:hypothetical protein
MDLAAIAEQLAAIQQAIQHFIKAQEKEWDRQHEDKNVPTQVTGTFGLPETVETQRTANQDRYHSTQKVIAVAAWAAFIAALCYAVVAQLQLGQIQRQTAELYHQDEVENATASRRTMETFDQLKIAQQQAKAARDSVLAVEREMRQDQRPWITIELTPDSESSGQKVSTTVTVGKSLVIPVRLRNIGKTPAQDTGSAFAIQIRGPSDRLFLPLDMTHPPHVNNPKEFVGINKVTSGTIFPEQFHDLPILDIGVVAAGQSRSIVINQDEIDRLTSGSALIYVVGTATYSDEFGLHHWTRFCTTLPKTENAKLECVKYNRADSNY